MCGLPATPHACRQIYHQIKSPTTHVEDHVADISPQIGAESDGAIPTSSKILGLDFSKLSQRTQVALCIAGLLIVPQITGYFQEGCFRLPGFTFSWFMTFFSFSVTFILSSLQRLQDADCFRLRAPLTRYLLLGTLLMLTTGLTNASLNYVNFPTKVVVKSAKVLPVMATGRRRRRYSASHYVAALCFVSGISMFALVDISLRREFSLLGIVLLTGAIMTEGFVGNAQETLFREHRVPLAELLQYSYASGALLCLIAVIANGELVGALALARAMPQVIFYLLGYSISGYLSISCALALIERFDALTAVVITSSRKLLTIVLSFLVFPKPFSIFYLWALALVALAAGIHWSEKYAQELRDLKNDLAEYWGRAASRTQRTQCTAVSLV